jgi:hypothetical protein
MDRLDKWCRLQTAALPAELNRHLYASRAGKGREGRPYAYLKRVWQRLLHKMTTVFFKFFMMIYILPKKMR